jgi:hypothetical protein
MSATTVPRTATTALINQPLLQVALRTTTTATRWPSIKRKFPPSPTVYHHWALSPFEFDILVALPFLRLLLAHTPRTPFIAKQAFPHLLGDPKKKFRLPTMTHFLEMFNSVCCTLVGLYVYFAFQFFMVLAFHVYIHRPLPHEWHCWCVRQPMYLLSSLRVRYGRVYLCSMVSSCKPLPQRF